MEVVPVNFRQQDASPEALSRDVDYALQIADFYVGALPDGARALIGKRVLEIGPGYSLGTAVLLACHGAEVTVADRFLAPWDPSYHSRFYAALLDRLRTERTALSPEPVLQLLEAEAFVEPALRGLARGSEELDEVEDGAFDLLLSNAVLEHVQDVPATLANMARITKAGGLGIHQVDFRDHRDFDRPLEFLTLDGKAFRAMFTERHGECGNRVRHLEMGRQWSGCGFDVLRFIDNMHADDAYLDDVTPRLEPVFAGMTRSDLSVISGCFVVRRKLTAGPEFPTETDNAQTLAHSRTRYAFAAQHVDGKVVLDAGCGAGLGSRFLRASGAAKVVGLDVRPEALDLARAADTGHRGDYREWDLEQGLPFEDGSFDMVVALEILEHVENQQQLIDELRRVLRPDGLALVSVPNKPFEEFWDEMAGETNPYHVHVPTFEEFVELLSGFGWVDFFGQVDVAASVVLPLDGDEGRPTRGRIDLPSGAPVTDQGTYSIVAVCRPSRGTTAMGPPHAYGFGNYQAAFGGAVASNQALAESLQDTRYEHFIAQNRLRWQELDQDAEP